MDSGKNTLKNVGKTRAAPSHSAGGYFLKAKEFYKSMKLEAEFENWNTVGLCGVHCAISASDSVLAKFAKIRNISQNHYDCVQLIKQHIAHKESDKQANRLRKIIEMKNLVEYLGDPFTEKQAKELSVNVDRYFEWAKQLMDV